MENKGSLVILCGLARAGKSTWCQQWLNSGTQTNKVIVNSDHIRLAMHGTRYNKLAEPLVHSITEIMVRSLYNQGFTVAIDETSTTVGSIRKWLSIDSDAQVIYIDTSVEECERRAIACGQNDLVDKGVIRRMYDNLVKLCNYTLDKRKLSGYIGDFYIQQPNHDDVMMSIEDIRQEVKDANSGK